MAAVELDGTIVERGCEGDDTQSRLPPRLRALKRGDYQDSSAVVEARVLRYLEIPRDMTALRVPYFPGITESLNVGALHRPRIVGGPIRGSRILRYRRRGSWPIDLHLWSLRTSRFIALNFGLYLKRSDKAINIEVSFNFIDYKHVGKLVFFLTFLVEIHK